MQRWFPDIPAPIIASNIPHLRLPPWYQRRPRFRDELVRRLLNIDPQTGAFRQTIVALVGLPGSGKSSMILEVLEQVRPFFQGGVLYGDQAQQSPENILMDWLRAFDQECRFGAPSVPILAERLEQAMKSRGGRYLLIIENIDGRWLHELRIPQRWLLVTTYGLPPLQPLGWEPYMVPIPAFKERDTIALLKRRLDGLWDRRSRVMARWLHRFVEGLPMAAAILAAVIRSRGWGYVCKQLRNHKQAVPVFQHGHGKSTSTSLAKTMDLSLENLSREAQILLEVLSHLAPGKSVSMEILEQLQNHESMARAGVDVESALHELRENLLLTKLDQHHLRIHRLVSLYAAERLPERAEERCRFDILGSLDDLLDTV